MTRWMGKSLALLAAGALALAGCSSGSSGSSGDDGTKSLRLAVLAPGALQWLHAVAEDQGFYKSRNLDVEVVQVQSSSNLVQAVASGSADAGIALGDNVISAVDKGAPITITGSLFQYPALRLYAGKGVTQVAQLAGKKVTAGAVEGGTADLLFYLLKENGVDWKSTTPVAIPNSSDRIVAMQNGQVAGALLIPPFDSIAVEQGATLLDTYDDHYVQTPAIVNTNWAKKNPAAAAAFTQGLRDAADWVYDPKNEADAVRILQEYASVQPKAAQEAYDFMVGKKIFSPGLAVPLEGLKNVVEISAAINGKDASGFDPQKYVDLQYLNQ